MKMSVEVVGEIQDAGQWETFRAAARGSRDRAAISLRAELASQTQVLGERLARQWKVNFYDDGAVVYTRAPRIIAGHNAGGVIGPDGGTWLAIPGPHCPPQVGRGLAPTPERVAEMYEQKLTFVRLGPNRAMLTLRLRRGTGRRGGFRAPSAQAVARKNTEQVILFFLVRQVRLKKVLNIEGAVDRWGGAFQETILEQLQEFLDARAYAALGVESYP